MRSFKTVEEYFGSLPDESRETLQRVRESIRQAAPGAEEAISYGMPGFRLNGYLVAYAAFKNHVGFYPTPSGIDAFRKELSKYKWAKGSVQFPMDKPMPLALIKKIVKFRVAEQMNRGKKG